MSFELGPPDVAGWRFAFISHATQLRSGVSRFIIIIIIKGRLFPSCFACSLPACVHGSGLRRVLHSEIETRLSLPCQSKCESSVLEKSPTTASYRLLLPIFTEPSLLISSVTWSLVPVAVDALCVVDYGPTNFSEIVWRVGWPGIRGYCANYGDSPPT